MPSQQIPNHTGFGLRNDELPFAHKIPPGGNWKTLPTEDQITFMKGAYGSGGGQTMFLRRLTWDEPALTITASIMGKATCQLHPGTDPRKEINMLENHNPENLSEKAINYMYRNWEHRASRIKSLDQPAATISAVLAKGVPYGIFYPYGKEQTDIKNYNVTPQLPLNGFTIAELFCGGGLMAAGLNAAGYEILFANDFDKRASEAYQHNIGDHVVCGDITSEEIQSLIPDVDIIAGGPPCQDFSVAGPGTGEDGERGKLVWTYLQIIENKQPKAFIFENVKGLLTKKHRPTFDALLKQFEAIGYSVSWKLINSWEHGVAQKRERVFIVGIRKDLNFDFQFPDPLPEDNRTQTLRDVIGDLPDPADFYYVNRGSWGEKMVKSVYDLDDVSPTVKAQNMPFPPGYPGHKDDAHLQNHDPKPLSEKAVAYIHSKDDRSLKKHRPPHMHEPSQTIVSNLAKGVPYGLFYPENHEGGVPTVTSPSKHDTPSNLDDPSKTIVASTTGGKNAVNTIPVPRRFTVRECLRIQSVPDWYILPSGIPLTSQYRIVGNGVAARVAYLIGIAMAEQLKLGGLHV